MFLPMPEGQGLQKNIQARWLAIAFEVIAGQAAPIPMRSNRRDAIQPVIDTVAINFSHDIAGQQAIGAWLIVEAHEKAICHCKTFKIACIAINRQ